MKTFLKNTFFLAVFLGSLLSFSSCFTIGAALLTPNTDGRQAAEKDLGVHQGWHKPVHKNVIVKLSLENGGQIIGYYKGTDSFDTNTESYHFARVKTKVRIENVPVKYITKTVVYPGEKKMGKGTAALVGLGIDIAIIAIAIKSGDGFSVLGDFELSGLGPK